MNTLEAYSTAGPHGSNEECARFVIDDTTNFFLLSGIAKVGQKYTFSAWVKSDVDGVLTVGGYTSQTSTDWTKIIVTFTATSKDVTLIFGTIGAYYIYHPQLEIGNKVTDWELAPEDVSEDIDDAQNTADDALKHITTAESIIQQLSDSISNLVTESLKYHQVIYDSTTETYTTTETLLDKPNGSAVEGAYTTESEQVYSGTLSDGSEVYYTIAGGTSLMTQTSDGWVFSTEALEQSIKSAMDGLKELTDDLGVTDAAISVLDKVVGDHGYTLSYINIGTYEGEPSIELGQDTTKETSENRVIITNTRILFSVDGVYETYIDADGLTTDKITINEELRLGGVVLSPRANGNLGISWRGVSS